MKRWMLLWMLGLLAGCTSAPAQGKLPYDAWYLGFLAPPYMEVWVETADVEDVNGHITQRAGAGTVSLGYSGNPAGWPGNPAAGGRQVTGSDLPQRIYIRWQSLVEPRTYRVILNIPKHARNLMLTRAESRVLPGKLDYMDMLVIGLAPGGVVKAWIRSAGSQPVEVLCQQAEVEPKGPYRGLSEGRHRPLSEASTAYLETHPIPYDSWKCPTKP